MDWTQTYPGLPSMVPAIRKFVRGFLADTPRADDAETIVAELAANALQHTPSGEPGGTVTVTVRLQPGTAHIAVSDDGTGGWDRPPVGEAAGDYGRGLILVEAVADKVGHTVDLDGQTMWADLTWSTES
jgi:anti-sigma regulatory factor (Ser/Thr protein kinase)